MPVYDLECPACGLEAEVTCSIDKRDMPLMCADCGESMKRVLVHDIRFQLKGTCWAKDGYSRSVGDVRKSGRSVSIDEEGNYK